MRTDRRARHASTRSAAVLVAGDVFDGNLVPERTIVQALAAMRGFAGPWVLLPGNHDAALAEGVWSRLERLGRPANVMVADGARADRARRRPARRPARAADRAAHVGRPDRLDGRGRDPVRARCGSAWPTARVAGPPAGGGRRRQPDRRRARRPRRGSTIWRSGDWHGTLEIAPRTWYAGTPEPDRFRANDAGNVLLVELDEPGRRRLRSRALPTARHAWRQLDLDLTGAADPRAALDRLLAGAGRPRARPGAAHA